MKAMLVLLLAIGTLGFSTTLDIYIEGRGEVEIDDEASTWTFDWQDEAPWHGCWDGADMDGKVTLTATPATGWNFSHWLFENDFSTDSNPYTIQSLRDEAPFDERTVWAIFTPDIYTITCSFTAGGNVDPCGDVEVSHGSDQTFTITWDPGNTIDEVEIDEEPVSLDELDWEPDFATYTFENVTDDQTLHVSFKEVFEYTVTASSTDGGTIIPKGAITVPKGSNLPFQIVPNAGYLIEDVKVDGESVGAVDNYHFNNVMSDHTIHAIFAEDDTVYYTITATKVGPGTIDPSGEIEVAEGGSVDFDITPSTGNKVIEVMVNGVAQGPLDSYTFSDVDSDGTIHAIFGSPGVYSITATADPYGEISPSGTVTVFEGESQTFSITPDAGYQIADVLVDDESVGPVSEYTFDSVSSSHAIHAGFAPLGPGSITLPSGWNLVSVPVDPDDPNPFGDLVQWRWNPAIGQYVTPTSIKPEEGYWVLVPEGGASFTVEGDPSTAPLACPSSGWQMISSHFPMDRTALRFTRGAETKTWAQANLAGWIANVLWEFDTDSYSYVNATSLDPWTGYWLLTRVNNITISFTTDPDQAASLAPADLDLPPPPPPPAPEKLTITLIGDQLHFGVNADSIRLYNLAGQKVTEAFNTQTICTTNLPNGIYLYLVEVDGIQLPPGRVLILR